MRLTHDGNEVHPANSPLPKGASGWLMCEMGPPMVFQGREEPPPSYRSWLRPGDLTRYQEDLTAVRQQLESIKTKRHALEVAEVLERQTGKTFHLCGARLSEMRLVLELARMEQLWPMREA